MPPLHQFLPKLAADSLRKVNVHSTIDFLNADNAALLNAFQDEQIRQSLLLFLMNSNIMTYQNCDYANTSLLEKSNIILNDAGNSKSVAADAPLSQQINNTTLSPKKLIELLKKYVLMICTAPGKSAQSILNEQKSHNFVIQSGIKPIDIHLNGGIQSSTVTEINGRAGSGKTYFCLRIAAKALFDNPSYTVCYIDTKHSFSNKRFVNICKDLNKDRTMQTIIPDTKHYSMLKRLLYFQAFDIYTLFDVLHSIKKQCAYNKFEHRKKKNGNNIKVLILDSVTSIGRPLIGSGYGGHALIMQLAQEMKDFATKYGIAVLITNATVSDQRNNYNDSSNKKYHQNNDVKAALGKVWQFVPNKRVFMHGV